MKGSIPRTEGIMLLEVLIAIIVFAFGMLALAGFHVRASGVENEAYQRAQATVLAQDMVDRIYANRMAYIYCPYPVLATGVPPPNPLPDDCPVGATAATPVAGALIPVDDPVGTSERDCGGLSNYARDICEWNNALVGVTEAQGSTKVGTLRVARGCLTNPAPNEYVVTVAWQGVMPTGKPTDAVAADCASSIPGDEALQRAVQMQVQIAALARLTK